MTFIRMNYNCSWHGAAGCRCHTQCVGNPKCRHAPTQKDPARMFCAFHWHQYRKMVEKLKAAVYAG